jgi:hypothetical protein
VSIAPSSVFDHAGSNDDLVKSESCLKIEQATSTAGGIMSSVPGNAHSMRWYAAHRSASGRRLHTGHLPPKTQPDVLMLSSGLTVLIDSMMLAIAGRISGSWVVILTHTLRTEERTVSQPSNSAVMVLVTSCPSSFVGLG